MKTMKTKNLSLQVVAVCLFALTQSFTSPAQQDRFYMKADAGVVVAKDVALQEFLGLTIPANSKISLDPGVRLGFRAGYGITDWFAGEIETGITANNIEDITGATEANGTFAKVPLMLNGRINLPNKYRVAPYFGAGAGIASTVLTANDIAFPAGGMNGSVTDVVFVYQAFAGFRIALGEKTALNLGYHYLNAAPSDMRTDDSLVTDRIRLGRSETHAVTVAFEWSF
jgi:opacity protein-like surface antigen